MMTKTNERQILLASVVVAALLIVALTSCASQGTSQVTSADADRLITDIVTREDSTMVTVTVTGSQQLSYTAAKQDAPLGVLLQFPETALGNPQAVYYPPENDTVGLIEAVDLGEAKASRIFIALKQDATYELSPEGANLKIVFKKPDPTHAAAGTTALIQESGADKAAAPPETSRRPDATFLKSVVATSTADGIVVTVETDGALHDYKSFTIAENPPRIVFDFPGIESPYKGEQQISVAGGPVSQIRHFAYPDRVRIVMDTQRSSLGKYSAEAIENGLVIRVSHAAAPSQARDLKLASGRAPAPASDGTKPVAAVSGHSAWVNRVEFASEDAGKSAVIIGTTRPTQYEIVKTGDKHLQLKLMNTSVPEHHRRALLTTRFESAVDRVVPAQSQTDTYVAIDLREDVPYTAEQIGNVIRIHFAASTVPPKPYESAELPAWKTGGSATPRAASAPREPTAEKTLAPRPLASAAAKGPAAADNGSGPPEKVFTGEKIALDFYDTDIKNVFRILQEISGKNFAIDKNVTGKVTLALQKPVPWDQVLDLILRMNQLGMTREGDIIRIASLATLQQEEKMRQAQLKAEQDARKQEEEGEPLVTAYIPINYSNAKVDVLPHITNILTPARGKASVDERNNQVIVTDIADKVRQARNIVMKIDQVTAQVVIEARVVEANTQFTREVGFDWGTITLEAFKIGGAFRFGPTSFQANNIPTTFNTNNTIGFNVATLFGTNLSIIDAKLTASEVEGKASVISAPKIVTLHNKKAIIKQGLEVPYLERDASGNATVRFKDVDLLLEVTPNVSSDRRILMNIFVTKNDVVDPTAPEPALSTNEARTEIIVEDGDTIVIGGILKDSKRSADQGIPGLRKLPALGWLFQSERVESRKDELLIFITPRIVQLEQRRAI